MADLVIFSTTENNDVSPGNNFVLEAKSSNKSFMYNRRSNGPSIEPWKTSASVAAHEGY